MGRQVLILVATMSGTAEMVADELAGKLRAQGWMAEIRLMSEVEVNDLERQECCLFCVATYGTGELPDNGKALFEQLQSRRPDLSRLRYGVVALGDSNYSQTYCQAGRHVDELLSSLGATRVGSRLEHDRRAPGYPEETALEWLPVWQQALEEETAQ